jgi:hypothetical protein
MLNVRPAAVAGTFYPSSPSDLARQVDAMLGAANSPRADATPKALIVPHAGYIYSGPVAASAYATVRPGAGRIRRVVLLGPAHRVYLQGLALPDADAFQTPLGVVRLDQGAASRIPWVPRSAAAHQREHSLEVQLPFLIRTLDSFELTPLAVGDADPEEVAAVLEALWGGPETLVVVSSDLSHYLPYQAARDVDAVTARAILDLGHSIHHEQACGATPVNGLLLIAQRRGLRPVLLDIRSSGDTAGSRAEVVGYGAFAFYERGGEAEVADAQ